MKILHVIRTLHDRLPVELACHQQGTHEVGVLLVQDGVYADPAAGQVSVYALRADLEARGLAARPMAVDYDGAIRLMAEYDRVIVW